MSQMNHEVSSWTEEKVVEWLRTHDYGSHHEVAFKANAVDGQLLLDMTDGELCNDIGIKSKELRKRILQDVQDLKNNPPRSTRRSKRKKDRSKSLSSSMKKRSKTVNNTKAPSCSARSPSKSPPMKKEKFEMYSLEWYKAQVGKSIKIFWPMDKMWYPAVITSVLPGKKKCCTVEYTDGEVEQLDLEHEHFTFEDEDEEDETPSSPSTFKCKECDAIFGDETVLEAHVELHKKKAPSIAAFSCSFCNRKFTSANGVTKHVKQQHKGSRKQHPCPHCEVTCSSKQALQNHLLCHDSSMDERGDDEHSPPIGGLSADYKRYHCATCGQPFHNDKEKDFTRHVRDHFDADTKSRCHMCLCTAKNSMEPMILVTCSHCDLLFCSRKYCREKLPFFTDATTFEHFQNWKTFLDAGFIQFVCPHCKDESNCPGIHTEPEPEEPEPLLTDDDIPLTLDVGSGTGAPSRSNKPMTRAAAKRKAEEDEKLRILAIESGIPLPSKPTESPPKKAPPKRIFTKPTRIRPRPKSPSPKPAKPSSKPSSSPPSPEASQPIARSPPQTTAGVRIHEPQDRPTLLQPRKRPRITSISPEKLETMPLSARPRIARISPVRSRMAVPALVTSAAPPPPPPPRGFAAPYPGRMGYGIAQNYGTIKQQCARPIPATVVSAAIQVHHANRSGQVRHTPAGGVPPPPPPPTRARHVLPVGVAGKPKPLVAKVVSNGGSSNKGSQNTVKFGQRQKKTAKSTATLTSNPAAAGPGESSKQANQQLQKPKAEQQQPKPEQPLQQPSQQPSQPSQQPSQQSSQQQPPQLQQQQSKVIPQHPKLPPQEQSKPPQTQDQTSDTSVALDNPPETPSPTNLETADFLASDSEDASKSTSDKQPEKPVSG